MTSRIKRTRGARCTAGGFRGCWPSFDAQTHGGGVSLFREVDIKGAVLPEKVVDKSTREALTRWISCRCFSSGESLDACTKVTNYDKHRTTL